MSSIFSSGWIFPSILVYLVSLVLFIAVAALGNRLSSFIPKSILSFWNQHIIMRILSIALGFMLILSAWSYINQNGLSHVPFGIVFLLANMTGLISVSIVLNNKWKIIVLWEKILFFLWLFIFLPATSVLLFGSWIAIFVIGGRGID